MKPLSAEELVLALSDHDEYLRAIGRLVVKWAEVEHIIYAVLLRYGKIGGGTGRAILSGTRAKGMMDFMGHLAANGQIPKSKWKDLEFVFAQATAINTLRDNIAHYGHGSFSIGSDHVMRRQQLITNQGRVARLSKAAVIHTSTEQLSNAALDLETISQHLYRHYLPTLPRRFVPFRKVDASTWLYKSLTPTKIPDTSREDRRKRPRRYRPSQA